MWFILQSINILRLISSLVNENDSLDENLDRLKQIKGVGPWTLKSIRLMLNTSDSISSGDRRNGSIFLYEDSWVRSRLKELYGLQSLSTSQAKKIGLEWANYQTCLSKFLWRIKPSGIQKIRSKLLLSRDDFV